MTTHWAQASASGTLAKNCGWRGRDVVEVYINRFVLTFPHTYFKLNLAFIFLPLSNGVNSKFKVSLSSFSVTYEKHH
jgi:hypothetical protein